MRRRQQIQVPGPNGPVTLDARTYAAIVSEVAKHAKKTLGDKDGGRRKKRHPLVKLGVGVGKTGWLVTRKAHARRRPLAPFTVFGVLILLANLLHHVPQGWRSALFLSAFGAGLIKAWLWWRTGTKPAWLAWCSPAERKDLPEFTLYGWRRISAILYLTIVYTTACLWLLLAVILGPGRKPLPLLLLIVSGVLAVPWWWRHRSREVAEEADERLGVWNDQIACPNGAAPGTKLIDLMDISTGWSSEIVLPAEGRLTTSALTSLATRKLIAKVYRLPVNNIIIEPAIDQSEDRARLVVITAANPLDQIRPYTGPTLDRATGWFDAGVHGDGQVARWRLFSPESGVCMGFIFGTTGSGKSGVGNVLQAEFRASGIVVSFLIDGDGGESLPAWPDQVAWFGWNIPEAKRILRAAIRIMEARKRNRRRTVWYDQSPNWAGPNPPEGFNPHTATEEQRAFYGFRTNRGKGYHEPTPEEPIIMVHIEEASDILCDKQCAAMSAKLTKRGRKYGIGVIASTQVPALGEMSNSLALRSMLASMNIAIFRTSDGYSRQMGAPGLSDLHPELLPEIPGIGFIKSSGAPRVSPMRAKFIPRLEVPDWAQAGDTLELTGIDLEAAGRDYLTWRERYEEYLDSGGEEDDRDDTGAVALVKLVKTTSGSSGGSGEGRGRRPQILELLSQVEQATTRVIAAECGMALNNASSTLRRMANDGQVRDLGHGLWGAPIEPDAVDETPDEDNDLDEAGGDAA